MTKALAVVVAVVVAVAAYTVTATAGQQAVTPKQFKTLSKKVTNLQKELRGLESCITQAVAVGQYGDGDNGNFGYQYKNSNGESFYTTALDLADPSSSSTFMLLTDSQCAQAFNGGRKHAKLVLPARADHTR